MDAFGLARRSWPWRKETTKVESAAQILQPQVSLKRLDGRDDPQARFEIPTTSTGASGNPPGETQGKTQVNHERCLGSSEMARESVGTGRGSETAIDGWLESGFAKATNASGERGRERHHLQEAKKAQGRIGRKGAATRPTATDFITDQYPEVERRRGSHPARGGHQESDLLTEADGG